MNVLIFVVKTDLTWNLYQIILPDIEMLISWERGWTSWWSWQRTTTPCPPSTSSDTPPHCLSTNPRLWSRVTSKYTVTGQCSVTRNKKKPTIQSEKQEGASGTLFLYLILTIAHLNWSVNEHWLLTIVYQCCFRFLKVVQLLLSADESFMKSAKSLWSHDFPGPITENFANMILVDCCFFMLVICILEILL